jgi:septal ring factor EnvC (AmiA/AmiB activator)
MKNLSQSNRQRRVARLVAAAFVFAAITPVNAQDVRGLEVCTAEKQMERRTSCLQANTEFLQGVIDRNARDARQKLDAAAKELAAARTEISMLKASLAAAQARLDKLEKANGEKAKGSEPKAK